MKSEVNIVNDSVPPLDSGDTAKDDAVAALARLIHAQMNVERRPMTTAIAMAKQYLAHICGTLVREGLRRPEMPAAACEAALSHTLDMAIADLDDAAISIAEAKEEPPGECRDRLSEVEENLERVTEALEQIEEDQRHEKS